MAIGCTNITAKFDNFRCPISVPKKLNNVWTLLSFDLRFLSNVNHFFHLQNPLGVWEEPAMSEASNKIYFHNYYIAIICELCGLSSQIYPVAVTREKKETKNFKKKLRFQSAKIFYMKNKSVFKW